MLRWIPKISNRPPAPAIKNAMTNKTIEIVSNHPTIYLSIEKMKNMRLVYILVGIALLGFILMNTRLFEGFRMTSYTTCPECQDDTDCVTCGFKNAKCDKKRDTTGTFGTCVPAGVQI